MSEQKTFSTALAKVNDTYFPMIQEQLEGNNIEMDNYSRQCVLNAISAINESLGVAGVKWNDPQLDQSNVTEILLSVASLRLNASASPNEVYFQVRNVKRKESGKDVWKKQIELGIEGDGNDSILARFGRDVDTVHQYWVVREDDEFEYPAYNGLEMTPPKWVPKGIGKAIKIVYPIEKTNNVVEYHITEREDVIRNLLAHISNNLMNETFGIAQNRYNATQKQREEINKMKDKILQRAEELGLDKALDDAELQKHISPAWKERHSRESMIIRKMRNNIVKRIPKDFGSMLTNLSYEKTSNDYDEQVVQEINANANSEVIDIEDADIIEPDTEDSETPDNVETVDIKDTSDKKEDKETKDDIKIVDGVPF